MICYALSGCKTLNSFTGDYTVRTESPPVKRRCVEDTSSDHDTASHREDDEVSDVICAEIARLHHRFVVTVDLFQHPGSKVISLLCRLGESGVVVSWFYNTD